MTIQLPAVWIMGWFPCYGPLLQLRPTQSFFTSSMRPFLHAFVALGAGLTHPPTAPRHPRDPRAADDGLLHHELIECGWDCSDIIPTRHDCLRGVSRMGSVYQQQGDAHTMQLEQLAFLNLVGSISRPFASLTRPSVSG